METTVEFMIKGWALFAGLCLAIWIAMIWWDLMHKLEMENLEWVAKCRRHEAKAKAKAKVGATAPRKVDIRKLRAQLGVKEEWDA